MAKKSNKRKKKKVSPKGIKKKFRIIIAAIVAVCVGVCFCLNYFGIITAEDVKIKLGLADKSPENSDTEVHFIDVGQGDCTLVISGGMTMVVDSGDKDEEDRAVKYLKNEGITEINYLIVTHPHADHIGEMADILENFQVDKFIMPKVPDELTPTTKIYENMLNQIAKQGLKITAAQDCEFSLGESRVEIFTSKEDYDDLNNYSTLVKVTRGENSFLITGDCEVSEEKDILSQGFDLSAKVLKAGHHGSSTSSSADFLNQVLPRYAVISCGEGNKYGHPHDETVSRIRKYADEIYITSQCGSVVFYVDEHGLEVKTEKGE